MSQVGGEGDAATDAPGTLAALNLRWYLRESMAALGQPGGARPGLLREPAPFVAWWAALMPLLFTADLECQIEEAVAALEEPDVADTSLVALPWLYAACLHLGLGSDPATRLLEGLTHHASAMRASVNQSLALAVVELRFDDRLFQVAVEECIRRQYTDAEHAALVLLAADGDADTKRRWAASQLVRHVGHSASLRMLLESAAEGRPLPNLLLAPAARGAIEALAPLMAVVPPQGDPAAGDPTDWPKFDAIRLGGDMWPPLVLNRIVEMPFLQASLRLG